MSNTTAGGWTLAPMQPCNLPQQLATGFSAVTQGMVGAKYVPLLYVGTQVVHGTNHMLICKQTLVVPGAPQHLVKMVLNQINAGGDFTGQWSLVSIEQIL